MFEGGQGTTPPCCWCDRHALFRVWRGGVRGCPGAI